MGHLFQDPLPRPDWTPGWGQEQITLGGHKDLGMGGGMTGAAGPMKGGGDRIPLPLKKPRVSRTHSDIHSFLSHPAAGVALGDQAVKGSNPSERGERGRWGRV